MILLKSVKTAPRQGIILENPTTEDVNKYLPMASSNKLAAFDYEATGLELEDKIVGVSVVDDEYPAGVYFSFKNLDDKTDGVKKIILRRVAMRPTIAHGAQYEQWMTYSALGRYANIQYDTMCLLNSIEGDYAGVPGNKGLKNLQVDLLGWEDKGDVELDEWLTLNGYVNNRGKVLKGEMHNAPDSVLGKYCNMDAQATWDLYQNIFSPILSRFPELDVYHTRDFQNLIRLIDEARREGITIDRKKLEAHSKKLTDRMAELMTEFYEDSPASVHIQEYNAQAVREHYDRMPPKQTKTGKPSSRYSKWSEKLVTVKDTQHFNANSKKQLAWLFYDCLYETEHTYKFKVGYSGFPVRNKAGRRIVQNQIIVSGGPTIRWEFQETSLEVPNRKVDKTVLPKLGRAGELLAEYNTLNKELGYVSKMLDRSETGVHYSQLRVSGTKTDRCSGTGGVNIQQLPKSEGYLSCLIPKKGFVFLQMDIDALEAVVLAELSACPSYMNLYGPNRPPNDVYLFIGSQIEMFKQEIEDAGYSNTNPTSSGIKRAKKVAKRIRTICKVIHLSSQYGAWPDTIHETLIESGIQISLAEVTTIWEGYWKTFEGVTTYRKRLVAEWKANKGFFVDGLGTPVTVTKDFEKDILNRLIQRTGHFILVKYLYHLNQLVQENKMYHIKPVLPDFHDETVWQVPLEWKEQAKDLFDEAWVLTNNELGGIIPLTGTPEFHPHFWSFKA
jgi:DNA polymerase I-like protein with 3'-5' exonuclease and polymerase domains